MDSEFFMHHTFTKQLFNMQEFSEKPPETGFQKTIKYFTLTMSLLYPAIGIYLLLSSDEQLPIDRNTKLIVGIILIAYGLFRFWRNFRNLSGGGNEPNSAA